MKRDLPKAIYLAVVGVAAVWLAMAALHGVADVWLWGHNGFNGAAFFNAARNSLRFGTVGQALYHFDTRPPPASSLYTHHPLLLHFHLIAMQWLFGAVEWAGRAVPAFYSVVDLLLVAWVTRRHWDRRVSAIASVVYALIPLNLIFANMIDHEQGSIAFLIIGVDGVVTYLSRRTTRAVVQACAGFAIAAQWDWPAYPIAFLLFCVVAWQTRRTLREHVRFFVSFALTMLVSLGAFFGWIWRTRGSLADMHASFAQRTSAVDGYAARLWYRSLDLYGPVLLVLFAIALVLLARRRREPRDLFVLAFLCGQVFHTLVFRQAGFIHAYWTWHANPAVAIAVAELVDAAWRAPWRRLAYAGTGVLMAWQAVFAARQLQWGYATGAASYAYAASDTNQRAENLWARELGRIYPREHTRYWVTGTIQRRRVEFDYYLDAPAIAVDASLQVATLRLPHEVALLDLHHLPPGSLVRESILAAAREHAAIVWDDRFMAVDLAAAPAPLRRFDRQTQHTSWWWSWVHGRDQERFEWLAADRDNEPVRGGTQEGPYYGGAGGVPFDFTCPSGAVLSELETVMDHEHVVAMRPWCDNHPASWYGAPFSIVPTGVAGTLVGRLRVALPAQHLRCEVGTLSGITVRADKTLRTLALDCAGDRPAIGMRGHYGDLIDGVALQYAP